MDHSEAVKMKQTMALVVRGPDHVIDMIFEPLMTILSACEGSEVIYKKRSKGKLLIVEEGGDGK